MDPDAAIRLLTEHFVGNENVDCQEVSIVADGLKTWLHKCGFMPTIDRVNLVCLLGIICDLADRLEEHES